MIKTENLSMVFTTEEVQTKALNEVNIEVKQSEFVAIMGPSGCGKSTLLISWERLIRRLPANISLTARR